jgi:hypothetical protein
MTTFAADQDAELLRSELERRVRDAWASYSASIRDLAGREYEEAEADAWEHLQRQLNDVAH